MISYHKLLLRQITKFWGTDAPTDDRWFNFLKAINDAYDAFENDRELSKRAFSLAEKEYREMNQRLKDEISIKQQSLRKLKTAINSFEPETTIDIDINSNEDNILDIVNYLEHQISRRKEAEKALLSAKEEAEKANKAKTDFLSVMSHEIRTPLNAILGMGHLLFKNTPRPDQVRNLTILKASSENLLLLINDILDFNKIEAGKLELEYAPFSIVKLIHDIRDGNHLGATDRQNVIDVSIESNIPEFVLGDSLRLRQIFTNLVSNAIKFTANGTIRITLSQVERTDTDVTLYCAVSDTGIGIDPPKLQLIFDYFVQASNTISRNYGGTGLGLAITKNMLSLMKSDIKVTSTPKVGSTFYFNLTLPIVSEDEATIDIPAPAEDADLQQARILLVEDTLFNVLYATQLLGDWNTIVDIAENGIEALNLLSEHKYDLILMDLLMPEMDGYETASEIRKTNMSVPIIALSASVSSNVKEKVLAAGMQDYVSKPLNPSKLLSKIKKYL
ncbi:MAG: response regulator [Bacteroidota bacterium]